jgi:hypothetical protein
MAKILEINNAPFAEFVNPGDQVAGIIKGFRHINTTYGEMEVADLKNPKTGEEYCLGLSSNLALYRPQLMEGMAIRVTYEKNEKNEKTKRTFKKFKVEDITDEINA